MFLTKIKVATVILLAVGVGAGLLTRQALAAKQLPPQQASTKVAKPAAPEGKDKAPPAGPRDKEAQAVEVTGQVLGADGKPCADAQLFVWTSAIKKKDDMPVRATTGADGRFRLTVAKADLERGAKIVAKAKDHGPDWVEVDKLDKGGDVKLRLAKDDVPINGRVIDLEGRPVAGVTIEVGRLEQSEMKRWMEMAKKGTSNHQDRELAAAALDGPTTVTTDKGGRFRLTGFGRERTVLLHVRGDAIEHCVFWVVLRDAPVDGLRGGPYGTYSATFTHHALPSKPIIGTVRDKATGKPLAGIAVVSAMYNNRWTKTDEKGQYRIVGAAKHDQYAVSAGSAPYLNCTKMDIPDTPGLEPLRVDFDLDRGVAIKGRLTDKATGKPVSGHLYYIPFPDNPNIKNYSELGKPQIIASDEARTKVDGSFTVTAIPGPGVLVATAFDEDAYLAADLEGIKVGGAILDGSHAVIRVSPSENDPMSTHHDVALVRGRAVPGTVMDPEGKPLAGAHAAGLGATPKLFDRSAGKLESAAFTVNGLHPKKSRSVLMIHPEKKLARMLTVRPDEAGPLTMRLEPTGALVGRIVDAEGKPLVGLKVSGLLSFKPEDAEGLPAELRFNAQTWRNLINVNATTDKDGKFHVEGLVPGLKYLLNVSKEMEFLPELSREGLTVESGKAKDLGELKYKPSAEKKEKE
jgi:protocatechuate 3,4-dioxygenase beta subunit